MSYTNLFKNPTKADLKYEDTGDAPRKVYEIGKYEVTVAADGSVTYRGARSNTDPKAAFPNMEIVDGEIRIPIEDLVDAALKRADPVELARAFWANEEVRNELIYCLAHRWSEGGLGDADRRKLLAEVKEAVHDKALDEAVSKATSLEYDFRGKWWFHNEIDRINSRLTDLDITDHSGSPIRIRYSDPDQMFRIGGEEWHQARDHWRSEFSALFPPPAEEEEPVAEMGAA